MQKRSAWLMGAWLTALVPAVAFAADAEAMNADYLWRLCIMCLCAAGVVVLMVFWTLGKLRGGVKRKPSKHKFRFYK